MPNFPTTPDDTRRWLKVSERNYERDAQAWWADRPTQRRPAMVGIEELDSERLPLGPRDVELVVRFLSTPATAECTTLIHELMAMTATDQARWFLKEMGGNVRNSGDRVRAHRAGKRLKEEFGE